VFILFEGLMGLGTLPLPSILTYIDLLRLGHLPVSSLGGVLILGHKEVERG
jgi:hypothetical protein